MNKLPAITDAVRRIYRAARLPFAFRCGAYPVAVALSYARTVVALRSHRQSVPSLADSAPYMYGDDGQLESFAHRVAGEIWVQLQRKDRTFGGILHN